MKISAILFRFIFEKIHKLTSLYYISAAVHEITMKFCTIVEYDPPKLPSYIYEEPQIQNSQLVAILISPKYGV